MENNEKNYYVKENKNYDTSKWNQSLMIISEYNRNCKILITALLAFQPIIPATTFPLERIFRENNKSNKSIPKTGKIRQVP